MGCLTSARFNMKADILRQVTNDPTPEPIDEQGEWVMQQDPDSGEIIRVWRPAATPDNPSTPDVDESEFDTFDCIARGIIDGGIRVAGTTQRWSEIYENVDYVKITFPAGTKISKHDRVTNIRGPAGNVIWKEEELAGNPPTVFNVMGVTPIVDPFGIEIEGTALLERADRQ